MLRFLCLVFRFFCAASRSDMAKPETYILFVRLCLWGLVFRFFCATSRSEMAARMRRGPVQFETYIFPRLLIVCLVCDMVCFFREMLRLVPCFSLMLCHIAL